MSVAKASQAQNLGPLVQWWLGDRGVELTYDRNPRHSGRLAPEFDAVYWLNGRRITEKAMGLLMVSDFMELNHRYSIIQVLSALMRYSWNHYCETQEYIDVERPPARERGPKGRPKMLATQRKTPEQKKATRNARLAVNRAEELALIKQRAEQALPDQSSSHPARQSV